jgi:hypothetical protein
MRHGLTTRRRQLCTDRRELNDCLYAMRYEEKFQREDGVADKEGPVDQAGREKMRRDRSQWVGAKLPGQERSLVDGKRKKKR